MIFLSLNQTLRLYLIKLVNKLVGSCKAKSRMSLKINLLNYKYLIKLTNEVTKKCKRERDKRQSMNVKSDIM